jgi:RNA recognition motif-containing protein
MESDAVEKTLFVGQVPLHSTVEDVTSWFATFGQIKECRLKPGSNSSCAFVKFDKFSQAEAAIKGLNGFNVVSDGPGLNISFSKPRPMAKDGEDVVSDRKIFIGQVPKTAWEEDLQALLRPYGSITHLYIHKTNGQHNGCAFCKFSTWLECETAIEALDGKITMAGASNPLQVKFATCRHKTAQVAAAFLMGTGKRAVDETALSLAKRAAMGQAALPFDLAAYYDPLPHTLYPLPMSMNAIGYRSTFGMNPEDWKLFIGQVPQEVSEEDLYPYFAGYGDIQSIHVLREKTTRKSQGCAFVQYLMPQSADAAIATLHGRMQLKGKSLIVKHANPRMTLISASASPAVSPAGLPLPEQSSDSASQKGAPVDPKGNHDVPHKLFVGQVPQDCSEDDLRRVFGVFGTIQHIHTLREPHTHRSKGCCFLVYSTPQEAEIALQALNGSVYLNPVKPLIVSYAKPRVT